MSFAMTTPTHPTSAPRSTAQLASMALALGLALLIHTGAAQGQLQTSTGSPWTLGLVLDASAATRDIELGARQKGLQLGHSDLTAAGGLGRHLHAQITAVAATHEGRLEHGIEEAWVESRTLPWGLNLRGGRFASQISALNAQHPHSDDFSERPLMYRAFLGQHWTDDGLRLNLTLPTPVYWMIGLEAFRGRRLLEDTDLPSRGLGAHTLSTRLGGDLDRSNSWQLGLGLLHNRHMASPDEHHEGAAEESKDHAPHGAWFTGRRTHWVDATWKWAPAGNNRNEQIRLTFELAQITDIAAQAPARLRHRAQTLSAVWRFHPNWEVGLRSDRLHAYAQHEGEWEARRLSELSAMLAWKPSHLQTLRLQWSRQSDLIGFESEPNNRLMLQYIVSFGHHGAHAY